MPSNKSLFKLNTTSPSFVATADIHIDKKLYNEPELEEDLRDNLARLVDLAIAKKVKYLVQAGDLFDTNMVKPHVIAFVGKQVQKLAKHGITMLGISGDHDKPLKGEAWYRIAGITPVSAAPEFAGIDYFDYSSVSPEKLMELLKDGKDADKVQWIVLHCQFPQLFAMAEAKKTIDFNKLDLFTQFPKLQGIIAGDLHFGPETKAYGLNHEAYVGYPGSLGQTDIGEAADVRRVLYCDGNELTALDFPQRRKMLKIDFRGANLEKFDVTDYLDLCRKEKFKPLLHITWDNSSKDSMHKLLPLHEVSIIHPYKVPVGVNLESLATSTDRTEVSTDLKIEQALRDCATKDKDEDLIQLSLSLITSTDPKGVLDNLKLQFNL